MVVRYSDDFVMIPAVLLLLYNVLFLSICSILHLCEEYFHSPNINCLQLCTANIIQLFSIVYFYNVVPNLSLEQLF